MTLETTIWNIHYFGNRVEEKRGFLLKFWTANRLVLRFAQPHSIQMWNSNVELPDLFLCGEVEDIMDGGTQGPGTRYPICIKFLNYCIAAISYG